MNGRRSVVYACALLLSGRAFASCGSAYCTVNTGWDALGVAANPGWTLDLRYEYLNQDTLRAGSARTAPAGVPGTHDETRTLNRNLLAGVDYAWNARWSVSLQVPYLNRDHAHVHNDPVNGPEPESWQVRDPGDVRVIGVYRIGTAGDTGVRAGVKLPTGATDVRNAAGELAERSLQPGTGSTDLILGGWRGGHWAHAAGRWFAQAQLQAPLVSDTDFRPGSQINLDAGISYRADLPVDLLLQLNAHWRGRDHGAQAEPEDSGSRMLALSPGVSIDAGKVGRVYGFVQLPLYQYVNGTQLTADWSAVLGWRRRF